MSEEADRRFKEKNPSYWKDYMRNKRAKERETRIKEAMQTMFGDDYNGR